MAHLRNGSLAPRKSYARIRDVYELPRLIEVQLDSFRWFQMEGLQELFDEVSPIVSFNKNLELHFSSIPGPEGFWFGEPKYTEPECRDRDMTCARRRAVSPVIARLPLMIWLMRFAGTRICRDSSVGLTPSSSSSSARISPG